MFPSTTYFGCSLRFENDASGYSIVCIFATDKRGDREEEKGELTLSTCQKAKPSAWITEGHDKDFHHWFLCVGRWRTENARLIGQALCINIRVFLL